MFKSLIAIALLISSTVASAVPLPIDSDTLLRLQEEMPPICKAAADLKDAHYVTVTLKAHGYTAQEQVIGISMCIAWANGYQAGLGKALELIRN